jgi:hypothetical protein
MDELVRFLGLLRSVEGVEENARQILFSYRGNEAIVSKDKPKGSSETDEPWKLPRQSSQQPEQKPPPKGAGEKG